MLGVRTDLRKVAAGAACLAEREEAVIAVESRDHAKNNGVIPKDQTSRGNKMRVFLVLVAVIGFGISANAQDVITLKNGTDINALVQKIGDVEIEYKKFDNPTGPNYTLKKSEILIIRYANGSKDIFSEEEKTDVSNSESETEKVYLPENKQIMEDVTPTNGNNKKAKNSNNDLPRVSQKFKRDAFGLDLGVGGFKEYDDGDPSSAKLSYMSIDIGFRYLHKFSPYVGWDVLKVKTSFLMEMDEYGKDKEWLMQIMTGVRGNSPVFYKKMSGYGAFRVGYAAGSYFYGLTFELEFGINFTPTVFLGYVYNYVNEGGGCTEGGSALRVGFNFGKEKEVILKSEGAYVNFSIGGINAKSKTTTESKMQGVPSGTTETKTDAVAMADIGLGYIKKYSQYIAWEIFKIRSGFYLQSEDFDNSLSVFSRFNFQLMTGARGYTPAFHKDMTGFAAFKPGVAFQFDKFSATFCFELEAGVYLTKRIFVAYGYNFIQNKTVKEEVAGVVNVNATGHQNYSAFRVGFLW